MLGLYRFCLTMRRLPRIGRLFIVLLSFVAVEALIIILTVQGKERGVASLLVCTGVLAALLFSQRTALALELALLIVYLLINIALKGWSDLTITSFVAGTLADLFSVAIIGFLWSAWRLTEDAKKKEKELAELKQQFITNIYHELRTPLTAILGSLGVLREDQLHLSEAQQWFLDEAVSAGNELHRLVENVLDAVRADSDVKSAWIRSFELDHLVLDALDHTRNSGYSFEVDVCPDLLVRGDSQQVGQVMRNLLSNCFKYTPKESPITIRVWREEAEAVVCVKDQGPGIRADEIPKLFQQFSRLERDLAGPRRGLGLGLYICRRLIENMGGRIWVESTGIAGEGSRFFFALPIACATLKEEESL